MSIAHSAAAALWHMGEFSDLLLRPEQLELKNAIDSAASPLVCLEISRRWGKSFTLVAYCIEQCIKNPGVHIVYGAAFQVDLEKYIIPAFDKILNGFLKDDGTEFQGAPDELLPKYIRSRSAYEFATGSSIRFVGIDKNPDGLRGNAIGRIVIDEAGYVGRLDYLYRSIIIPATAKQKDARIIVSSSSPISPTHFFCELAAKAKVEGVHCLQTIDDISDLAPEEKARLIKESGGIDSVEVQREYYCKHLVDVNRAVCPTFVPDKHVRDIKPLEHHQLWIAGDTGGVTDLHCFLLMSYDYTTGQTLILDERWKPHNTPTTELVQAALELEPSDTKPLARYVDAHGQTRVDFASLNYGVVFPIKDDFSSGLSFLRNQFFNDKVLIHPRCKLLISTLKSGLLNKQRSDFVRTEALGHCDALMALLYGLRHKHTSDPTPEPDFYRFARPHTKPKHNALKQGFTR